MHASSNFHETHRSEKPGRCPSCPSPLQPHVYGWPSALRAIQNGQPAETSTMKSFPSWVCCKAESQQHSGWNHNRKEAHLKNHRHKCISLRSPTTHLWQLLPQSGGRLRQVSAWMVFKRTWRPDSSRSCTKLALPIIVTHTS